MMENQYIYKGDYIEEWECDDNWKLTKFVRFIPASEYLDDEQKFKTVDVLPGLRVESLTRNYKPLTSDGRIV